VTERSLFAALVRAIGTFLVVMTVVDGIVLWRWMGDQRLGGDMEGALLAYGFRALAGIGLLLGGGAVAQLLYPHRGAEPEQALMPALDLTGFATRLVGLYALVEALKPLAALLNAARNGSVSDAKYRESRLLEFGLYVLLGAVLLVGPRRIGRFFRRTFGGTKPEVQGAGTDDRP
jgi:hypothetical protein